MANHWHRLERLHGHVKDVHDELEALPAEERAAHEASLGRLAAVVAYADAVLDAVDARLVTATALGAVQSAACRISNDPRAALANADACADALVDALALLPEPRAREEQEQVRPATEQLAARLQAVRENVDAEAERLQTLSSEVDRWSAQAQQDVASRLNALEEQAAQQQQAFKDSQRANAAEFRTSMDAFRAEIEERAAEIGRMESETATLVEAIAVAGTSEHYRRQGRRQRIGAEVMRGLAVLATLAAVSVALLATVRSDATTQASVANLLAALLLVGLAAYFARQSARHRAREEEAARVQFELAAFSPFVEALTPEQREQERVLLTRKLFGTAPPATPATDEGDAALGFLSRRRRRKPTPAPAEAGTEPAASSATNGSAPL